MKGILKQASKGWFVWYESIRADLIANGYDSLPVLQLEFSVSEKQPIIPLENDKEVEFEIVRYCPYHKCSPSEPKGCTVDCAYTEVKYAKLVEKDNTSDQTVLMKDKNGIFYEMSTREKMVSTMKAKTNGERFDEFMDLVNQPPYPELEGTLEVCKDIINFRSSEISDEEIEEAADEFSNNYSIYDSAQDDVQFGFREGATWYREQLNLRK
jgi:hypothetical protein